MKVTFVNRERRSGNYSFETIFSILGKNLEDNNIDIHNYYRNPEEYRIKSIYKVTGLKSDVFHITGDVNYLAMGLPSANTIITIHDLGFLENPVHSKIKRKIYKIFWFEIPVKRAKYITTVSQFTKDRLVSHFNINESKIRVINNAITLSSDVKKKNSTLNSCPNILQIGTGDHKNLNRLLHAINGKKIQLTIVGKPGDRDLELIKRFKIVHEIYFDISRERLIELYLKADILFFASIYEGFGLPIIEANQVGLPVISSNICSMPEVSGNAALLVNPYNVDEIAESIDKLLSNENMRLKLIENGFDNVKRFDINKISADYIDLYEKVYNENH